MRTAMLVGTLCLAACSPQMRAPSACQLFDTGCVGTNPTPIGGSGRTDGGVRTDGGDAGDVPVMASGFVVIPSAIPRPSSSSMEVRAAAWTIEPLAQPMGTPLRTTTDDNGLFSLAAVPTMDERFALLARPPIGSGTLATLSEFAAASPSGPILAVTEDLLQRSLAATGVIASVDRAHLVIEVLDVGLRAAGVSASIAGMSPNIVYDGAGVLSSGVDRTGPLGTIALLNIAAATSGERVSVTLSRDGRSTSYSVLLAAGSITVVSAPGP